MQTARATVAARGKGMTSNRTLTTLFEGGNYFECPRWREGRWWVSDFYRHAVFSYDPDGRDRLEFEVEAQPSGRAGRRTATSSWSR